MKTSHVASLQKKQSATSRPAPVVAAKHAPAQQEKTTPARIGHVPLCSVPFDPSWPRSTRLLWIANVARWLRSDITHVKTLPDHLSRQLHACSPTGREILTDDELRYSRDLGKQFKDAVDGITKAKLAVSELWDVALQELPPETTRPLNALRSGLKDDGDDQKLFEDLISLEDGARRMAHAPPRTLLELANHFRQLPNSPPETDRAGWKTCIGICEYSDGEWICFGSMTVHLDEVLEQAYQAGAFNGDEAKPLLAFLPHGDRHTGCFLSELGRLSGIALTGQHELGTIAGKIADAFEKVARAKSEGPPERREGEPNPRTKSRRRRHKRIDIDPEADRKTAQSWAKYQATRGSGATYANYARDMKVDERETRRCVDRYRHRAKEDSSSQ